MNTLTFPSDLYIGHKITIIIEKQIKEKTIIKILLMRSKVIAIKTDDLCCYELYVYGKGARYKCFVRVNDDYL